MKSCIECASTDVVYVSIKHDDTYLFVQWICTYHLMELLERMNRIYPTSDYETRIRTP